MKEETLKCPICRGWVKQIHQGTRDNASIAVYECHECGTKFLSTADRENDYENGYMFEVDNVKEVDTEEWLRMSAPDDIRRHEMLRGFCRGKRLLDFGCGFGGFLTRISEVTDTCCGVEPGKQERKFLSRQGIRCFKTLEECGERFDMITLFHVFEHLSHPDQWLEKLSKYLEPGGIMVIEVPNAEDALLSLYESGRFADFTYWSPHLFLYTMKSLSMLIEKSGFYTIESAGQVQRYSIANHLMWLAKGKPGGHEAWSFLDSKELNAAYEKKLREIQKCDTLFFKVRRK